MTSPVWGRLRAQERAVDALGRAAARPVHAYLVSGPPGTGLEDAARAFAAALLCREAGCAACSSCERILRGRHPDVVEVEPEGSEILVGQAGGIIEAAFRSPVEGARKVIVIHEAERLNEAAANKLLKTFEEPPASTVFVLLTTAPDELLDTVRSRCQSIALSAVPPEELRRRRNEGPYAGVAEAFAATPGSLDGTGGSVGRAAAALLEAVDESLIRLGRRQEEEVAELDTETDQRGYADRVARRMRKTLTDRHKRLERRARTDALAVGLGALEETYRDALVGGAPASGALAALDAIAEMRRALQDGIVLNWGLQLEHLLLSLPSLGAPAGTLADRSPG